MDEEESNVTLLLYDYNIVGKNMGTHSAITVFGHEYWFSIEGIKKRNCRTKTKFRLNEESGQWVQAQFLKFTKKCLGGSRLL